MSYLAFAMEMLSNMFKPPVTTDYPLKPREPLAADRGKVVIDISKCIFCGSCQRNCPADAITVTRAKGTWEINPFSCVQCRACVDNCPKKCLTMDPHYTEPATEKKNILIQGEPPAPPKKPVVPPKPVASATAAAPGVLAATAMVAASAEAKSVEAKPVDTKSEAPAKEAENA